MTPYTVCGNMIVSNAGRTPNLPMTDESTMDSHRHAIKLTLYQARTRFTQGMLRFPEHGDSLEQQPCVQVPRTKNAT